MPAEQASKQPLNSRPALAESVLIPFLRSAQNSDGGWGYHADSASRVEATAWAVLALEKHDRLANQDALERATGWLRASQLRDGSWPAWPGAPEGSWATSLACLALVHDASARAARVRGIAWLCREYPPEARWFWRVRYRLSGGRKLVQQDPTLHGWNWAPRTASWVEPTAYAVLLLASAPSESLPGGAAERRRRAEAMLFNRMCPGGGWNLGNPQVYGVAGVPGVTSTCWALLALQGHADRLELQQSLEWLRSVYGEIEGANSLALAHICLEAYGCAAPPLEPALARIYSANQFLNDVRVSALAMLALLPGSDCLRWKPPGARP